MKNETIIQAITEKCDIFYDDFLLSKENIIRKYLRFFSRQFKDGERSVSFAFHTGSISFDIVSVAALMIGCLAYDMPSNDEILNTLNEGDMVIYKGERYRWGGKIPYREEVEYIVLTQDAKGKNGSLLTKIPYDDNKHLVKPYWGESITTDGRGIRKTKSNRNDFISYILDIPIDDVPTTIGISMVVVSNKNEFHEICKHLRIRYANNKYVKLTDIVPVSYYTSSGKHVQIEENVSKAEAVIKVTSKMSVARDLILDKHSNKVIGLLVTNVENMTPNTMELSDLLRRKTLKFAYVVSPFDSELCDWGMEQYENAQMFACTKELLSSSNHDIQSENKITRALNRQISNILSRKIITEKVDGCWTWEEYRNLKAKLYAIKYSNWSGEERDNFIWSSLAVMNLFTTAFFDLESMEQAIETRKINPTVISPEVRLTELQEIAIRSVSMKDKCEEIVDALLDMYSRMYLESPKGKILLEYLEENSQRYVAIVVPKAYYSELFNLLYRNRYPNAVCVTANSFDKSETYDAIITVGDVIGKRFDSLNCYSATEIMVLLYEFEAKTFDRRKHMSTKSRKKLNARIKGLKGEEYEEVIKDEAQIEISEETVREFSELDDFVNSMALFDIQRVTAQASYGGSNVPTSEVKYIGTFTTGEHILFSKYYSAVVLSQNDGKVIESAPEKLVPGDVLVFTKRDDYTRNIVDYIFDQLIDAKKLSDRVQDATEKASYWKDALRKYREENDMTYRDIAKELKKHGSSRQEVTVRQWLMEDSHIIGPNDLKAMEAIAATTKDPYLLAAPKDFFEACRTVRKYRGAILKLMAEAIKEKLSNKKSFLEGEFEIVYENVDKLSEILELEEIFELDEVKNFNNNMVNRPIMGSEVL